MTIADQYGIDIDPAAEALKPDEERWVCTDDAAATWLLRKLGEVEAELAAHRQLAADEHARIDAWLQSVAGPNSSLEHKRAFFEGAAVDYTRRRFEAEETITVTLPTGTLTNRKGADRLVVDDEEAFVAWAVDAGRKDLLAVKVSVAARETKAALEDGSGLWYREKVLDVALQVEVDDAGSLVWVVDADGEKCEGPGLGDWHPIPEGGAILPASPDGGPAFYVPGVRLEAGVRTPKVSATLL